MSWNYKSFSNDNVSTVIKDVLEQLNETQMNHNALAKVGLSNMEGDPARGVVYWYVGTPETSTLSNTWLQKTFTTGTHYSDMYEDMQKFMNGLPLHQAQNSIIDMTNYQGGDATLTIYYPTK